MKEIISVNRKYIVQSEKAHSYRVTIPKKIYDKVDEEIKSFGVKIDREGINSTIDFHTHFSENLIEREVVRNTRTIRIPSTIGDTLRLRRKNIKWKLYSKESKGYIMRIISSYIPLNLNLESWDYIGTNRINIVKRDNKEHFEFRIDKKHVKWCDTDIEFILAECENKLCLRFHPASDPNGHKTQANPINNNSKILRLYVPRDIVRSLNLVNKKVDVYGKDDSIFII